MQNCKEYLKRISDQIIRESVRNEWICERQKPSQGCDTSKEEEEGKEERRGGR